MIEISVTTTSQFALEYLYYEGPSIRGVENGSLMGYIIFGYTLLMLTYWEKNNTTKENKYFWLLVCQKRDIKNA
jgi:hypothetical protein